MTGSTDKPRHSELLLSIGGIAGRILIDGAPSTFVEQLRTRYAAVTLPLSPVVEVGFSLRVTFTSARPALTEEERRAVNRHTLSHPLVVKTTDATIRIERWDLEARLRART